MLGLVSSIPLVENNNNLTSRLFCREVAVVVQCLQCMSLQAHVIIGVGRGGAGDPRNVRKAPRGGPGHGGAAAV